jgi:SAM-dependent methyltransferase
MTKVLSAAGYDTDKSRLYLRNYAAHFSRYDSSVNLLELGIFHGGSLLMWRDHFLAGNIVGLDINEVKISDESGRIKVYMGRQEDIAVLDRIGKETGPFDIVIDDASHIAAPTKASFWHLFDRYLKPGGMYVIEDWRVGYWGNWADGGQYGEPEKRPLFAGKEDPNRFKSHDYGLVGLVKQLIDELGADAYTHASRGSKEPHRMPRFRSVEVFPGQVFIVKATQEDTDLLREPWQSA